jgi:hypothetical protein
MKDYIPVTRFRNHETALQSSVEVTKFFTSNGSARAVRNNLWFVSVGSTCSPDLLHTTDVVQCRKDFDCLKCCDGTFYRLQGSYADPQNSELFMLYRGADKSLARPTSRCVLCDGENILFDASLVIYINSTNIPPIMIINRIYEHKNLLSL